LPILNGSSSFSSPALLAVGAVMLTAMPVLSPSKSLAHLGDVPAYEEILAETSDCVKLLPPFTVYLENSPPLSPVYAILKSVLPSSDDCKRAVLLEITLKPSS